jgi:hypothetical protein
MEEVAVDLDTGPHATPPLLEHAPKSGPIFEKNRAQEKIDRDDDLISIDRGLVPRFLDRSN